MLVVPDDDAIIPDLAQMIISGMGTILSPTAIVRTIMDQVFDWDPLAEVLKTFSGDWNRVAQASRAYTALADYVAQVGDAAGDETASVLVSWNGEAATALHDYMTTSLIPALTALSVEIANVAGEFQSVSVGMFQTAQVANDAFNFVIDLLVIAAAESAAAAAMSWTGVGAVVGVVAIGATVFKIIQAVKTASNALAAGQALLDVTTGLVPGYLGAIHGFNQVPIPAPVS